MGIHAKAERESTGVSGSGTNLAGLPAVVDELGTLHAAYARLYQMRGAIGQLPPSPYTWRARVGLRLVQAVQRMLFWYTPQIHSVQNEVTNTIGSLCKLIEMQMETIGALTAEVKTLHLALDTERPGPPAPTGEAKEVRIAAGIPPSFEFALQDRFRGSERETRAKAGEWLGMIATANPLRGAEWLDIGCGRGEWLSLARDNGYVATGIDANPVAVKHCNILGFRAEQADAVAYLRTVPDGSLGLVSMFHVVEHMPVEYLLQLLPLAFQKLAIGGLIVIETPNPGNLLMGSHYFWNDPTHQRPLPEALLTFMLEYAGFAVVRRAGLNHFPTEEHLPWTEIGAVRQVDALLYDARDYGVMGRK